MRKLLTIAVSVLLLIGFGVASRKVYAACVPTSAGYCAKDWQCSDDGSSWCGPGDCCQQSSGGGSCGDAAAPACNGWCAAGTSCNDVNGNSCACTTGGGPGEEGTGGCPAGYEAVEAGGTFSITATDTAPQSLSLTGVPAAYICTPGCGSCPTKTGVSYPSVGNNFFLTQSRQAWWQAVGI